MYAINPNLKDQRNTATVPKNRHHLQDPHTTLFPSINNSYNWQDRASSLGNWK